MRPILPAPRSKTRCMDKSQAGRRSEARRGNAISSRSAAIVSTATNAYICSIIELVVSFLRHSNEVSPCQATTEAACRRARSIRLEDAARGRPLGDAHDRCARRAKSGRSRSWPYQLREFTGTRLVDWVDHLALSDDDSLGLSASLPTSAMHAERPGRASRLAASAWDVSARDRERRPHGHWHCAAIRSTRP